MQSLLSLSSPSSTFSLPFKTPKGSNLSPNPLKPQLSPLHQSNRKALNLRHSSSASPSPSIFLSPDPNPLSETQPEPATEKFDWFSQWYPLSPVCDLDRRAPHAKRVLGLDVVVWWDREADTWQVFDDRCPHRLAPLSEGRIDKWGRLQCAYHGWCFDGKGSCKYIPQAPPEGPPV